MDTLLRLPHLQNLAPGQTSCVNIPRMETRPVKALLAMPIDIDQVMRIRLRINNVMMVDYVSGTDEESGALISAGRLLQLHNRLSVNGHDRDAQLYIPLPDLMFIHQLHLLELSISPEANGAALNHVHLYAVTH